MPVADVEVPVFGEGVARGAGTSISIKSQMQRRAPKASVQLPCSFHAAARGGWALCCSRRPLHVESGAEHSRASVPLK